MFKSSGLTLCFFLTIVHFSSAQSAFRAKVISVIDGDTVTVLRHQKPLKIRLAAIDAPEWKQDFGKASKKFLSGLVFSKIVQVDPLKNDRYGRLIAFLQLGDVNVNLEMVRSGYAWHYKRFDRSKKFAEAQALAQHSKLGLWSASAPVPPWEFRVKKRDNPT